MATHARAAVEARTCVANLLFERPHKQATPVQLLALSFNLPREALFFGYLDAQTIRRPCGLTLDQIVERAPATVRVKVLFLRRTFQGTNTW
ncbi:hypothetical protein LCGC14_2011110 [marine sediment metagenome]|uniref:Uncharacterized protein n=1 Tax=marine sediment metagenome TaxID=412755 RepID=A0A0F9F0B4_9ZZZZ